MSPARTATLTAWFRVGRRAGPHGAGPPCGAVTDVDRGLGACHVFLAGLDDQGGDQGTQQEESGAPAKTTW